MALNADPNQSVSTIHSYIILFWTKFYAVWYFHHHHSSFFLNPLCVYFKILTDSSIKQRPMGFIFNPVLYLSQMQTWEYKKDISSVNEDINLHSGTILRHMNTMNSRDWKHFIYVLCPKMHFYIYLPSCSSTSSASFSRESANSSSLEST